MVQCPCPSWVVCWLHILLLAGWDMEPFLCHTEAAGDGFLGESLGYIGKGLFQRRGVDSGGRDGLPCDFVLPGPQLLRRPPYGP